nr:tyrosine-type recombinase/integrase [Streptomyces lydicus]
MTRSTSPRAWQSPPQTHPARRSPSRRRTPTTKAPSTSARTGAGRAARTYSPATAARQLRVPGAQLHHCGLRQEVEPLTAEEGRRLLAAARSNRLWAAYELAVRIGLRRGEVLVLRWSDVDLHEGVVTVRQALQRVGGELLIVAPKTQRSARRVALPSECVTALRAQRAQQIADGKAAGDAWKGHGHGLVFTTKNGTPIEPRNLNRSSRHCAPVLRFAESASTTCVARARHCSTSRTPMPA